MTDSAVPDFKSTEIVLFIGGAVLTIAVFVIAVVLFRVANREHRQQLERERKERGE
jgi:cytochrome c-type biogenesis protein CcmH/NrfF